MMGSGKTTIGIRLAELTGMRWYDTDDLITQKYGRIADIFEFYGEERFRQLETEIVHQVAGNDGCVISTGGGCVLRPENSAAFKEGGGRIVFLKVDIEVLFERTGHTATSGRCCARSPLKRCAISSITAPPSTKAAPITRWIPTASRSTRSRARSSACLNCRPSGDEHGADHGRLARHRQGDLRRLCARRVRRRLHLHQRRGGCT